MSTRNFKVRYSSGSYWYIVNMNKPDYCAPYEYLLPDGKIEGYQRACNENWKTEQEAQRFLDNYLEKCKLKVSGSDQLWYIYLPPGEKYLLKTGEVLDWFSGVCKQYPKSNKRTELTYFKSQKEAQDFLDNYLKGQNVSTYDDRLAQCDKDIAALQAEKAKIVKEKEAAEVKKFYLGTEFNAKDGRKYLLVRMINYEAHFPSPFDYVGLVKINEFNKGFEWKHFTKLEVKSDYMGYYVTKLPTTYPGDFGFDVKYGV